MRRLFAAIATILAALAAVACPSGVAGPPDGEGGQGGSAPPVITFGESACGACVAAACDSHVATCESDPECAAFIECLRACPVTESGDADPTCEASCPHPTAAAGQGAVTALSSCRASGDGAACVECGRMPEAHPLLNQVCAPPTSTEACTRCEEEYCCESRCNADCETFISCMQGCGAASDCEAGCAQQFPAGALELGRWLGCQVPKCPGVCMDIVPGPCLECGLEHCANQFADCFAQPACFMRWRCGFLCDDVPCYDACDALYAEADALFAAFLVCVGDHCLGGACEGGF